MTSAQTGMESDAYYGDDRPIVSDRTYDQQFDELTQLEQETGVIFPNSPTQIVSGAVLDSLNKVRHIRPMLSANKTKSITTLCEFAKKALPLENSNVMVSWKEDGLTLVLRYFNGHLMQAITRGTDGIVGEDVTHTVKTNSLIGQSIFSDPIYWIFRRICLTSAIKSRRRKGRILAFD